MPKVCFYFLLHQPYRLTDFAITSLDNCQRYFECDGYDQNREVLEKVADKCYRPMLSLLLDLVEHNRDFCFSFSVSGVFLEQVKRWTPDVLSLLQRLSRHEKQVEVVGENYYHSLSALYSEEEFAEQVALHREAMAQYFGVTPRVFRNTEMIYNNYIAWQVAEAGYEGILTEGVDRLLDGQPKTRVYRSNCSPAVPILLKNAQLSDDIAFRFSQKSWTSWPLTADKYLSWLEMYDQDDLVNLFMDFETFGEHQWAETGIFDFYRTLVETACTDNRLKFIKPSDELVDNPMIAQMGRPAWLASLPVYNVDEPISWADEERDLSAWRSNALQHDTLRQIYALEKAVKAKHDPQLLQDWRRLQTSDHFYYMCTKYFADGDVHAYFSAYNSPLEAYRRYCIVLADLMERTR